MASLAKDHETFAKALKTRYQLSADALSAKLEYFDAACSAAQLLDTQ